MNGNLRESRDFDSMVRNARMERSVAVGDAIASLITATVFGINRALDSLKPEKDPAGRTG